jgi:hypothetical protein
MPTLFLAAFALLIRVVTLDAPYPDKPDWNILNGFGYLWNPDFSALLDAKTWLAAAGQIFFTLSVGIGVILTYASYLRKGDDIALSGLTAASTNEFAEVILGGSIIIPLAFAFFGPDAMREVAASGAFNLGFVTMPFIFSKISLGALFSFLWFFLLFLAGLTSSISLIEPAVAFIRDDFQIERRKSAMIVGGVAFILCQPAIFFLGHGVLDELDFWGGDFLPRSFRNDRVHPFRLDLRDRPGLERNSPGGAAPYPPGVQVDHQVHHSRISPGDSRYMDHAAGVVDHDHGKCQGGRHALCPLHPYWTADPVFGSRDTGSYMA